MSGPGVLALASALLSTGLWGHLVWTTLAGGSGDAALPAAVAGVLFPGVAWAGAVAAHRESPFVTLLTGVIGFMPVGLYFLPAPGALRFLGVAPLLMIAAGVWGIRRLDDGPEEG